MPIGVFDSGLGGLTVLGALRAALPAQEFIYFGDNANAPFGTRGADEIYDLTCKGVASDAFPRELWLRASGLTVTQQACPGLVDALEAGDDAGASALVRGFCEAVRARCAEPEVAVLGCTHYPLVESAFRAALAPAVRLISQPRIVAESLGDYLHRHPRFAAESGGLRLLTSGDPALVDAFIRGVFGAVLSLADGISPLVSELLDVVFEIFGLIF